MSETEAAGSRRIFVTGAGGFVGGHLCRTLIGRGWQVIAAARDPRAAVETPSLSTARLELFSEPDRWQAAMRSCRGVVHLAGIAHQYGPDSALDPALQLINVEGARFVAENALQAGVKRFVFVSSIKVNGEGGPRPYVSGDAPDPKDAYGRSKWAAEQSLAEVCAQRETELVIVRPPLVYGPGVKANFRRLMRLAHLGVPLPLAGIVNRRSLLGVGNLVDFLETCLTHPAAADRTWLVSDGQDVSTPELLTRLATLMGRRLRLFGIPPSWLRRLATIPGLRCSLERLTGSLLIDASAARERLGWQPPVSLEQELSRTVAAYLTERTT